MLWGCRGPSGRGGGCRPQLAGWGLHRLCCTPLVLFARSVHTERPKLALGRLMAMLSVSRNWYSYWCLVWTWWREIWVLLGTRFVLWQQTSQNCPYSFCLLTPHYSHFFSTFFPVTHSIPVAVGSHPYLVSLHVTASVFLIAFPIKGCLCP